MINVLITGAASGIGKAVKDYYLNNGHNVYAIDVNSIDEQENLTSFVSDITNEESLLKVKQYFIDNNITLDIIINVAGIHKMASLVETEYNQMKKVIDINLCGTMLVNNVFHDRLDKKGRMACQYHENEDKEWCFRFYGEQIKNIWDEVKENTQ